MPEHREQQGAIESWKDSERIRDEIKRLCTLGERSILREDCDYGELYGILGTTTRGCKELLKRGGRVPHVLYEAMRFKESFHRRFKETHNYNYFGVVAGSPIKPININQQEKVVGYLCLRSMLVERQMGGVLTIGKAKYPELIKGVYDVTHLIMSGDEDSGWAMPNATGDSMIEKGFSAKTKEGIIWSAERLSEVTRRLLSKNEDRIPDNNPLIERLTKLDNSNNGLSIINFQGGHPKNIAPFSSTNPNVSFGNYDVRNEPDVTLRNLTQEIHSQIRPWISNNRALLQELLRTQAENAGQKHQGLDGRKKLAGGKEGDNLSPYYYNR